MPSLFNDVLRSQLREKPGSPLGGRAPSIAFAHAILVVVLGAKGPKGRNISAQGKRSAALGNLDLTPPSPERAAQRRNARAAIAGDPQLLCPYRAIGILHTATQGGGTLARLALPFPGLICCDPSGRQGWPTSPSKPPVHNNLKGARPPQGRRGARLDDLVLPGLCPNPRQTRTGQDLRVLALAPGSANVVRRHTECFLTGR